MTERVPSGSYRRPGAARSSRSARSSAAYERDSGDFTSSALLPPAQRFNPSLRSVGSRASLSEQFATTRREYEFGFDDGASMMAPSEVEGGFGSGGLGGVESDDEELTAAETEEDGVVVVRPGGEDGDVEGKRRTGGRRGERLVRRSHHELLCLSEDGTVSDEDVRRAYFRLYDILRSRKVPAQYREMAEGYFDDVQAAFETLIGSERRNEYEVARLDERDAESSDDEVAACDEDGEMPVDRRAGPRYVRRLRRQHEQDRTEVGVQLNSRPLLSRSGESPLLRRPLDLPAAVAISHSKTVSLPSVSRILEPQARQLRDALKGPEATKAEHDSGENLELYCTPPTVTVSSVLASNVRTGHTLSGAMLSHVPNLLPDAVPKDRPLQWYTAFFAPLVNLRFRQEVFFREPGKTHAALRETLPDAVVDVDVDALNEASVTARASHAFRLGSATSEEAAPTSSNDEPVHFEASASLSRSRLLRNYSTRVGIAAHKRLLPHGGTAFACVDSGTSIAPWGTLVSPESLRGGHASVQQLDDTGASWRSYMDQLSRSLAQGFVPHYYSPATAEVGYRFSTSFSEGMGLQTGRPFTKQAGSGLRRLSDDVDLLDASQSGSWTVSGAVSAGGVAGYLRYGKDILSSDSNAIAGKIISRARRTWRELLGFRLEAELTVQKMKQNAVLRRLMPWGRSEISHLAVRGLKKIGQSHKLGLELAVTGASNTVVLSFCLANREGRRIIVPLMLLRDGPHSTHIPSEISSSAPSYAKLLFYAAFLPALGVAAIDHILAARNSKSKNSQTSKQHRRQQQQRDRRAAARRAEADALVALLAGPVLHSQRLRRDRGGLVILSAKFGALDDPASAGDPVPQWTALDEVADVSVAVAALVDEEGDESGGRLCIPAGTRKSKLLGFWDPRPGRTKWLVVRYSFGGREETRAVSGREELRLP